MGGDRIKYEFLSTDIFDHYDTHLVFTGVTRNSKAILKNITDNLEKVKPVLETVDYAYDSLIKNDYKTFFEHLNNGWKQKKETSDSICENEKIVEIDNVLENNESVIAHKLCGAGNGGFFLAFSSKESLNIPYKSVRINVSPNGVMGRCL
jgi:D-glycero-alpha-D-manno-heptose-7-phosphate kinase